MPKLCSPTQSGLEHSGGTSGRLYQTGGRSFAISAVMPASHPWSVAAATRSPWRPNARLKVRKLVWVACGRSSRTSASWS